MLSHESRSKYMQCKILQDTDDEQNFFGAEVKFIYCNRDQPFLNHLSTISNPLNIIKTNCNSAVQEERPEVRASNESKTSNDLVTSERINSAELKMIATDFRRQPKLFKEKQCNKNSLQSSKQLNGIGKNSTVRLTPKPNPSTAVNTCAKNPNPSTSSLKTKDKNNCERPNAFKAKPFDLAVRKPTAVKNKILKSSLTKCKDLKVFQKPISVGKTLRKLSRKHSPKSESSPSFSTKTYTKVSTRFMKSEQEMLIEESKIRLSQNKEFQNCIHSVSISDKKPNDVGKLKMRPIVQIKPKIKDQTTSVKIVSKINTGSVSKRPAIVTAGGNGNNSKRPIKHTAAFARSSKKVKDTTENATGKSLANKRSTATVVVSNNDKRPLQKKSNSLTHLTTRKLTSTAFNVNGPSKPAVCKSDSTKVHVEELKTKNDERLSSDDNKFFVDDNKAFETRLKNKNENSLSKSDESQSDIESVSTCLSSDDQTERIASNDNIIKYCFDTINLPDEELHFDPANENLPSKSEESQSDNDSISTCLSLDDQFQLINRTNDYKYEYISNPGLPDLSTASNSTKSSRIPTWRKFDKLNKNMTLLFKTKLPDCGFTEETDETNSLTVDSGMLCHQCNSKYVITTAKYCSACGALRINQ